KVLTGNVATITTSSITGFVVGQTVIVATSPGDAVYDGAYVITAVSNVAPFSFSYARTNANLTLVSTSGTVFATSSIGVIQPVNGQSNLLTVSSGLVAVSGASNPSINCNLTAGGAELVFNFLSNQTLSVSGSTLLGNISGGIISGFGGMSKAGTTGTL